MSEELKPCPFCGGPGYFAGVDRWCGVGCLTNKCPAHRHALMFRDPDEAIATWNRRTPPDRAIYDSIAAKYDRERRRSGDGGGQHG